MTCESNNCLVCERGTLEPTSLTVRIPNVLKRWEEVMSSPFPAAVWRDYAATGDKVVIFSQCTECGFGRFDPVVTGTAGFYEAISATDYYNSEKWEFYCAADDLKESGAHRILDVGCGSGRFLDYLRSRLGGAALYGYDLNEGLVAQLAKRGFGTLPNDPVRFDEALAGQPPFDAICMLQILEHVADPVNFLEKFLRLLKPGGLLIVTTPNAAGPIRFFPDALTEIPPHHVTRWTERAFAALLPKLGASIRSVKIEPLPEYLWDSYLPPMWDDPIWPAQIFDPLARKRGLHAVGERAGFAAQAMRSAGIRWLHGVSGHTIYVTACREEQWTRS